MFKRSRAGLAAALLGIAVPAAAQPSGGMSDDGVEAGTPGSSEELAARRLVDNNAEAAAAPHDAPAVALSAIYTADLWANLRGGLGRGGRYLDNLDLTLTVDAERAFGWPGATLFAYGLYNNGEAFSADLIGDTQGISNIETGVRAARLYEAWIEERFAANRASVKVGLYDLNSEFDAIASAALFLNPSHGIGPDFAQSGRNGPSIFPSTSLAIRGDFEIAEKWLVRAAILDGVPGDPERPRRTAIKLGKDDGALAVAELNYLADGTKAGVGYWRYTGRFEDLRGASRSGQPAERRGNDGLYMFVEQRLAREGGDDPQGLAGWLRLGLADAGLNPIRRYVGGGVAYTGVFRGRDEDQVGIAAGWVRVGRPFRRSLERDGDPVAPGELISEATYRAPVTPWLTVQPDIQYVVDPGGRKIGNALIIGLRTEIGF